MIKKSRLHTDSGVQVPSAGQATTQQFLWFLEGSLDDLWRRVAGDLKLKIASD